MNKETRKEESMMASGERPKGTVKLMYSVKKILLIP